MTKPSSMFPRWMRKEDVCALIALDQLNNRNLVSKEVDVQTLAGVNDSKGVQEGKTKPISRTDIRMHIVRGVNIVLQANGSTVYPVHGGYGTAQNEANRLNGVRGAG